MHNQFGVGEFFRFFSPHFNAPAFALTLCLPAAWDSQERLAAIGRFPSFL